MLTENEYLKKEILKLKNVIVKNIQDSEGKKLNKKIQIFERNNEELSKEIISLRKDSIIKSKIIKENDLIILKSKESIEFQVI